jgi:hypothetical protein
MRAHDIEFVMFVKLQREYFEGGQTTRVFGIKLNFYGIDFIALF